MSRQQQQLILSPFAQIKHLKETGKAKVWSLIHGQVFEVGRAVTDIMRFLQEPRSMAAVEKEFAVYQTQLKPVLYFLQEKGLVTEKEKQQEQLVAVRSVQNKLFHLENFDPADKRFSIPFVGVPFGRGNPRSINTAKFPSHLRKLSQQFYLNLSGKGKRPFRFECLDASIDFSRLQNLVSDGALKDYGNVLVDMNEASSFIYDKIHAIARSLFRPGNIPFFIGGDHSISYPIIKAAAEQYPNLHVIHFDAHTDTYTSPFSNLNHAGSIHHHGNFVSKCLEETSMAHIYQFGIRGVSNILQQDGPRQSVFWCSQLKKLLAEGDSLDLPEGVPYYVTFDIDVLDPGIAPATATPVPSGFTMEEVKQLFRKVLPGKNIVGLDLVETSPELDTYNTTTESVIEIILYLLNYLPAAQMAGEEKEISSGKALAGPVS